MEEDVHGVRICGEDWRQEVPQMRWTYTGVAAAPVHQGCPVPFYDFDIVAWAAGHIIVTSIKLKAGELQPQHLPTLYLYPICPLKVVRITFGVVWRDEDTCGIAVFQVELDKENIYVFYFKITHPRCHSRQQGRVMTWHARVRLQWSSQGHKQGGSKVHLGIGRSSSGRQK